MSNPDITPKTFRFLTDLAKNNNREWFAENKDRFEGDLREPLLGFIEDFSEHLEKLSPHFEANARKVGGSLFRIFRDVRFSKDKSPYKTNAGVHFRHERAKDVHAPGYYLHLDPKESLRIIVPAVLALTLGFQTILSSFFLSVLGLGRRRGPVAVETGADRAIR